MSEREIAEAIASQEEYIQRWKSCLGQVGLPHDWVIHIDPQGIEENYDWCARCKVPRHSRSGALERKEASQ